MKKLEREKSLCVAVPFTSWLACKTAAAASGLPMKEYLAWYLGQAAPMPGAADPAGTGEHRPTDEKTA